MGRQRSGSDGARLPRQRKRAPARDPGDQVATIVLSDSSNESDLSVVEVAEPVFSSTFPLASNRQKRARVEPEPYSFSAQADGRQQQVVNTELDKQPQSFSQPLQPAVSEQSLQPEPAVCYQSAAGPLTIVQINLDQTVNKTAIRHVEASASAVAVSEPATPNRQRNKRRAPADEMQSSERQSYLEIFDRILNTVLESEAYLFSDAEQRVLAEFSKLDRHSRYLYTRIFMRKQAWHRVSGLNYGEDMVVEQSCKYLAACPQGSEPFLLTECEVGNCDEAVALLLLPELKAMAKAKGIKQMANKPKEALCSAILKTAKQRTVVSFFKKNKDDSAKQRQNGLIQEVLKITGPLVQLNPVVSELFERLHLVFFRSATHLGDNNSMRSAVLAIIGQIRFPSYTVVRSPDLFASRDDVVRYKMLVEIGYQMEVLLTALVKETERHRQGWDIYLSYKNDWQKLLESLKQPQQPEASKGLEQMAINYWRRHFTPDWALVRIVERGARFAANLKQFDDERDVLEALLSQDAYRLGKRGEWYERLVLLYATHLRPKRAAADVQAQSLAKARDTCIRALDDVHVNRISRHAISRQLRNIEAKLGIDETQQVVHPRLCVEWAPVAERTVYGMRIRNVTRSGPSIWDGNDGIPCSVEQLALWRYKELGFTGVHSENAMVTTLFSLLFWDIIFHPLPGVLDTEYQSRPLDMSSESFYFSRRAMIEQRLLEIGAGQFEQGICSAYRQEHGSECVGVTWDLTCEQLLTVAKHIGGKRLAAICRVLATEYRLKRSGFPDLCLWNEKTGQVMFAEVKGPKDKLSETQRDWLDILVTNHIDVEVCLVREGDARDVE